MSPILPPADQPLTADDIAALSGLRGPSPASWLPPRPSQGNAAQLTHELIPLAAEARSPSQARTGQTNRGPGRMHEE